MEKTKPAIRLESPTAAAVEEFVKKGLEDEGARRDFPSEPIWKSLSATGTEIWLDTGDIDGATKLWRREMTALTTNNTLLFKEVDKGIYDDLARSAADVLGPDLDDETRIIEIAFILNARHGLRLVKRFGARVSVELHTDLANDVEGTIAYARRFHRIEPSSFVVKIPFTPAGLLATRALRADGIPINMTLGFSARQNYIAALFAAPDFLNVFLGRLNSYVSSHRLGSGDLVGEKATLASQRGLREVNDLRRRPDAVRQIAASMRSAEQVPALAGVDVHTMPLGVAEGILADPPASLSDQTSVDPQPGIEDDARARAARLGTLWQIDDAVRSFARALDESPPVTPRELVDRAHESGVGEIFPRLSGDDQKQIAADGKIPVHDTWAKRIERREAAVEALLNAAGLASFAADQKALDDRVRGVIAG